MNEQNKDIKFPTHHYVGFQVRSDSNVPLGFMTPDGNDEAAKKRKYTVDEWAKKPSYYNRGQTTLPAKSFENVPMSGFKMVKTVRHGGGWGRGEAKWRVEDPRGFELEITSPNFAKIIDCTTIENGEILEKCMWARLRSENILVPVSSELYKAAQANTVRASKTADIKDAKPGDKIIMANGSEGIYMGRFHSINLSARRGTTEIGKKKYFIRIDGTNDFNCIATIKVSEIIATDKPMTEVEAMSIINTCLSEGGTVFEFNRSYGVNTHAVCIDRKVTFNFSVEDYDLTSFAPKETYEGGFSVFVDLGKDHVGVIDTGQIQQAMRYSKSSGRMSDIYAYTIDRQKFESEAKIEPVMVNSPRSRFSGTDNYVEQKFVTFPYSSLSTKCKRVKVTLTAKDGSVSEFYL